MSEGQWKRWDVISRLRAGKLTMAQAALVLALSVRQVRRVRDRVAQGGRQALRHGNTGRAPAHRLAAAERTRIGSCDVRSIVTSTTRTLPRSSRQRRRPGGSRSPLCAASCARRACPRSGAGARAATASGGSGSRKPA